jgi:hypothetical protein
MVQMARNATDVGSGSLRGVRYLLHDRIANSAPRFWMSGDQTEYGQ